MSKQKSFKSTTRASELHKLEADAAFFDARLSFVGDNPDSTYQLAQQKTYEILTKAAQHTLDKRRKRLVESASKLKKK